MSTREPKVLAPVIDRLGFVLPLDLSPSGDDPARWERAVARIKGAKEDGMIVHAHVHHGRYARSFAIPFSDGRSKAIVQVGALQPKTQNGGINVMLNPSKLNEADVQYFHSVMRRIVGKTYDDLMLEPRVNALDVAVDINNVRLENLLVSYKYAHRHTVFGKTVSSHGAIETMNFGSVSSDYFTSVYDKSTERRHAAMCEIARKGLNSEDLAANFIRQVQRGAREPDCVRVEVRGRKLRGLRLWQLGGLDNRFARFEFVDLAGPGVALGPLTRAAFLSIARDRGAKAALEQFDGSRHAERVRSFWNARRVGWWRPGILWLEACVDVLPRTGIFPAAAFEEPVDD